MEHRTIKAVLDRAIVEEKQAVEWYREMALQAQNDDLRKLFESLVKDEDSHRSSLERVRNGDLSVFAPKWPLHTEVMDPPDREGNSKAKTFEQSMLRAIEAERRAFLLYKELAMQAIAPAIRTLFESLAKQEANHWAALDEQYTEMLKG